MYSLKVGSQNVPTTFHTVLCSPAPKGVASCDRGGISEVPAAGTQRAFNSDVAFHLPLLDGL